MSLTKKVYLTISGYDIKLSDNLTFYQKDQLKLIFYINEYGIDYENNATARALMPVNPLNAILFIENPDGVDSVSSAKIEDNAVTFYLDSTHTQYVGVSRMQLRLFDQDGCAITLPHFTFEIRENIYGSGDIRFQNVVMVDQTGTVILTEDNDMLDVGDVLTMGTEIAYPQVTKTIKELPIKHGLDGTEKLIVEDNEATKQAPLGTIVDEIKQNSQEKIREIESDLAQTNAQLSEKSNEITVDLINFGAKFNGVDDDAIAFNKAIQFIKENKGKFGTFKLKTGKMLIKSKIDVIDFACNIIGDGVARTDDVGTLIIDDRPTDDNTPLFEFKREVVRIVGGSVANVRFDGNGGTRDCIYAKGLGWDWNLTNVQIHNFRGSALKLDGVNDANYLNIFIDNCGSINLSNGEIPTYAIEIMNGTNAQHFTSCHFEHCRYFIHDRNSFNNTYLSCKFEQSTNGINGTDRHSPIFIENPRQIIFDASHFISIGALTYYDKGYTLEEIPYFINVTSVNNPLLESITIANCGFMCGAGSGNSEDISIYGNEYARYIVCDVNSIISNNTFLNTFPALQSIMIKNKSTFTNNMIITKAYGATINGVATPSPVRNVVKPIAIDGEVLLNNNRIYDYSANPSDRIESVAFIISEQSNIIIDNNIIYGFIKDYNSTNVGGIIKGQKSLHLLSGNSEFIIDDVAKNIKTKTDGTHDLGEETLKFKNIYFNGFFKTKGFTTRPDTPLYGTVILDANINKWIWFNGSHWLDFLGNRA